jgi:hypothetical protein
MFFIIGGVDLIMLWFPLNAIASCGMVCAAHHSAVNIVNGGILTNGPPCWVNCYSIT